MWLANSIGSNRHNGLLLQWFLFQAELNNIIIITVAAIEWCEWENEGSKLRFARKKQNKKRKKASSSYFVFVVEEDFFVTGTFFHLTNLLGWVSEWVSESGTTRNKCFKSCGGRRINTSNTATHTKKRTISDVEESRRRYRPHYNFVVT